MTFFTEQKTFKTNTMFLNQKGIIAFSFFTNRLVQYQALLNRRSLVLFEDLCLEYNLTVRVLKFNCLHEKILSA